MPKRRRVDLSLRLEEAKTLLACVREGIVSSADDFPVLAARLVRVEGKLSAGITYVTEVNPTHRRPTGAKARTP